MATEELKNVETVQRAMRLMAEDLMKAESASKGIAQNFAELAVQVSSQNKKTMSEYLMSAIKLPPMLKAASAAMITPLEELNTELMTKKESLALAKSALEFHEHEMTKLRTRWVHKRAAQQTVIDQKKQAVALAEKELKLIEHQANAKKILGQITGKEVAIEFLALKGFADAIKRSGELNKSLMEANSNYAVRAQLARDTWQVMAKTGNEQQDMMAAAKALAGVGFDMRKGYKDALEVVVQMEEGLGVSYENSAQLARIFEINLKTPVRDVADKIAIIANNTSLAADEATRFATEIGKAIRLLGPMQGNTAQVTGYMTMMAGRMKDVGGNAEDVVKMFSEMTKGTAQGFMLRGLSGVNTPGALRTEPGAQAAMRGIDRMISQIVSAAPGTMAYTAQLESAAQIFGTSTETIRLWREMMVKANEPLTAQQTLQKRWQEQIANANKALTRIKESTIALIQQAFNPLLERVITPLLGWIAELVSKAAQNKIIIVAAFVAVNVAIAKTIWSLARLTISLIAVAKAATQAALAKQAEAAASGLGGGKLPTSLATQASYGKVLAAINAGIGGVAKYASKIPGIGSFLGKWIPMGLQTQYSGLGILSKWNVAQSGLNTRLWGLVGRLGTLGPVAAVAAAGALGYGLGRLIDRKWPNNWIAMAARQIGEESVKAANKPTQAQLQAAKGDKFWWEFQSDLRQLIYQGREADLAKYVAENMHRVKGIAGERGAARIPEIVKEAQAQARERIGLAGVTVEAEQQRKRDEKIIQHGREAVEQQSNATKTWKAIEERRRIEDDLKRRQENMEYLKKQSREALTGTGGRQKAKL